MQQTGGANTPYTDLLSGGELARSSPASNPNANLNTITPAAIGCVTAECAGGVAGIKNSIRDINDVRNDVADGAAIAGRGADITAATSTMAAAVPGPHQPGAATTAIVATGVGFMANVVEQAARPDVGRGLNDLLTSILQERIDRRVPIVAPITNELTEAWKQSGTSQNLQTWSTQVWTDFINKAGGSK